MLQTRTGGTPVSVFSAGFPEPRRHEPPILRERRRKRISASPEETFRSAAASGTGRWSRGHPATYEPALNLSLIFRLERAMASPIIPRLLGGGPMVPPTFTRQESRIFTKRCKSLCPAECLSNFVFQVAHCGYTKSHTHKKSINTGKVNNGLLDTSSR